MESNFSFLTNNLRQDQNELNSRSRNLASKSFDSDFKRNSKLKGYSKKQIPNVLKTKSVFSAETQKRSTFFTQQFEPKNNKIIRRTHNNKNELKPHQTLEQIKMIQRKINSFRKYSSAPKQRNNSYFGSDFSFLGSSKLQNFLEHKNQFSSKETQQLKHQANKNLVEDNKKMYEGWYIKAIQTHLMENNQKIDLRYSTQENSFITKTVINQKKIGNTVYPKLSAGFKKKSVSYEIKYI